MKKISILFVSAAIIFAAFEQEIPLTRTDGTKLNGLFKSTILAYDSSEGGELIWAGTTDGTLPSLRVVNGYIHNIDDIIPSYLKGGERLWIEVNMDGRTLSTGRIAYLPAGGRSLRRETPMDSGEIAETFDDELQIGRPGLDEELYVASARTGFGIDAPVERVEIDGVIGIKEGTAPTASADFGKVYVDEGDGHLYYMDEGGTATDLLETSSGGGGSQVITAFSTEQIHSCIGQTIYLGVHQNTSEAPYTHLWTGDTAPLSATNIADPTFTATTAGVYSLNYSVTDGLGQSSSYSLRITVHPDPTPSITSDPSTGGCEGEPVVLTGDGCYQRYCWSPGPCTKLYEVSKGGTYTLEVVDEWGCRGSVSEVLTFIDPPAANAGSNRSVCSGGTDPTVGGSPVASGGTPPYTYTWSGSGASFLSSIYSSNPTFDVSGASPGVYSLSVSVTDDNGCTDDDGPITVTVFPLPTATANATSPVCPGDPIELTGLAGGGASPYNFAWSGPSGFTSIEQSPTISSAVEANQGTYSLTVTDDNGCVSPSSTVTVIVDDPATISSNPTDVTTCEGTDAVYTVVAAGTSPFSYQWERSTDGGSSWTDVGTDSDTYTATSVSAGMTGWQYRCEVTSVCTPPATSTSASLTVNLAPTVTVDPTDQGTSPGTPVDFTVTATGTAPLSYQWQRSTDDGSSWSNVGTDSDTYTVSSPTESMTDDRYRCIVSGACPPPDTSGYGVLTVIASGSITFTYTGGVQTWTVPGGVTMITGECWGAEGGVTSGVSGTGGDGGYAKADIPVTPGETLNIYVGQMGPSLVSSSTGGWNGGGGTQASSDPTGCGGGASDIRRGTSLSARLLVGGGGGGAGYQPDSYPTNVGGVGGGLTGGDGGTASWCTPSCNGKGGTQFAGGAGGDRGSTAESGSFGQGGRGLGSSNGGGGGGGGWYGGGGGQATAGGGGSSYVDAPGNINTLTTSGVRTGNGQVTITW